MCRFSLPIVFALLFSAGAAGASDGGTVSEAPEAAPLTSGAKARSASGKVHRVASGDTLSGIANRYGVRVVDLTAENGIGRDSTLKIGQELRIPAPGRARAAGRRTHVVESGDTLGKIALRYGSSVEALLAENKLRRTDPIRIGQTLTIPAAASGPRAEKGSAPGKDPAPPARDAGMQRLNVPGAPPAYYFEPIGPGRLGLRPVIVYLHGRGAIPSENCQRWASVARRFGWVVCPQGPEDRGGGKRGWANNWVSGHRIVLATIQALRSQYGRRVQLYGNTLVGFSEGAFVAMNIGVREARAFNRWLILGANSDYWGPQGLSSLARQSQRIRRVYLITGQRDAIHQETDIVRERLRKHGVTVRISTPKDLGHEVALVEKASMYKAALHWLEG